MRQPLPLQQRRPPSAMQPAAPVPQLALNDCDRVRATVGICLDPTSAVVSTHRSV